jgi:glycosyltransferase involved in cell wall biosynthesis
VKLPDDSPNRYVAPLSVAPLVSIIIPCFNAEKYVGEAIQSALDQTYSPTEVIVIDDGSTDGSLAVIQSFGDAVHWETGPNRGGCAARNRGVTLARGELIQFLDADDFLDSNKLERQVPLAVSVSPRIVYCGWRLVFVNGKPYRKSRKQLPKLCPDPVVFTLFNVLQTSTPLYPRQLLRQVGGFTEGLPCMQEYDLNLRLACAGVRFHRCSQVLMTRRKVPGSVSSDYVRLIDQSGDIFWRAFRGLRERGELTEDRAAAFAAQMTLSGRRYLRYGLIDKATARFAQAYQMHPSAGLDGAYGRVTCLLRKSLGPVATERLVQFQRKPVRLLGRLQRLFH